MAVRWLHHFTGLTLTDCYWELPPADQSARWSEWWAALQPLATRLWLYQVFPARTDTDLVLWSALQTDQAEAPAGFFGALGQTLNRWRPLFRPAWTLWGFTRPSVYASGRSAQEIDPLATERPPYLIIYPFSKTAEWYLLSKDTRQGMMNEHIRVGREYPTIKQLLVYSFGLQDQEFVVVYETDDLTVFSDLVMALRSTQARAYTLRDTPIITAFYRPPAALKEVFSRPSPQRPTGEE